MKLTYTRERGYHFSVCLVCGKSNKEPIPDQADQEYQHNPGNPVMAVCPNCNGGIGTAKIITNGRLPQAKPQDGCDGDPLSYRQLDGDWGKWVDIAKRFERKVRFEDREDFLHDLMLEMAEVRAKYEAKGKPLTEAGLMRVASYEVSAYWEKHKLPTMVVDCGNCSKEQRRKCREEDLYSQCSKVKRFVSLNERIGDGDGKPTELWEAIADDRAIDLEAWIDARTWLLGCPKRLVQIAHKRAKGLPLNGNDQRYLNRYQRQLKLPV